MICKSLVVLFCLFVATQGQCCSGDCGNTILPIEYEVLNLLNAMRAEGYCCVDSSTAESSCYYPNPTPLVMDCRLHQTSFLHSKHMQDNNYFSHTSQHNPPKSPWTRAGEQCTSANGENIAKGQTSAQQVFDGWRNSYGHCRNMFNENFETMGVSLYGQNNYWTQMFGKLVDLDATCYSDNNCANVTCPAQGQCVEASVCNSSTSICEPQVNKADGTVCGANNEGACDSGICDLCVNVVCPDTLNDCTVSTCEPRTGQCSVSNKTNGTSCEGGNGVCFSGTCGTYVGGDTCADLPSTGLQSGACANPSSCTCEEVDTFGWCYYAEAYFNDHQCPYTCGECDEANECASDPCGNGTCVDHYNGYTCHCLADFDGLHCEIDNSGFDACGVFGGDDSSCADQCGIPNGDDSTCSDQCGVPNGDDSTCSDQCGVPNGDNSSCTDLCGVVNGANACVDECGVPNGDNSSCIDDCGVVNGGNASCADQCGVANGDNSTCTDACGVINGDDSSCADVCGVPNGDNSTCMDACGVPNGDNTSCADECGVPNGDGSSCSCASANPDPIGCCAPLQNTPLDAHLAIDDQVTYEFTGQWAQYYATMYQEYYESLGGSCVFMTTFTCRPGCDNWPEPGCNYYPWVHQLWSPQCSI